MEGRPGDSLLIVISFLVAVMVYNMPLPHVIEYGRPEWVSLVLLYWAVALPNRIGLAAAWAIGLILDVLSGAVLGRSALAMLLLAFLAKRLYQRLRMFPALQQALIVFLVIGLQLLLLHWIDSFHAVVSPPYLYLIPSLTSALFWPFVYFLLHAARLRFR